MIFVVVSILSKPVKSWNIFDDFCQSFNTVVSSRGRFRQLNNSNEPVLVLKNELREDPFLFAAYIGPQYIRHSQWSAAILRRSTQPSNGTWGPSALHCRKFVHKTEFYRFSFIFWSIFSILFEFYLKKVHFSKKEVI